MTAIARYSFEPGDPVAGWSRAFGIANQQLSVPAPWAGGAEIDAMGLSLGSGVPWLVVVLVALAAVLATGVRRARRDLVGVAVVAVTGILLALVSTSRLTGFVATYMVRWWWAVSLFTYVGLVWAAFVIAMDRPAAAARRDRLATRVGAVATVVALALGVTAIALDDGELPLQGVSTALNELSDTLERELDPDTTYLIRTVDPRTWSAAGPGLFLMLERAGFDVRVEPEDWAELKYGDWRVSDPSDTDVALNIVSLDVLADGEVVEGREIARFDPLTESERAELRATELRVRELLGDAAPDGLVHFDTPADRERALDAGISEATIERFRELRDRGNGFVVMEQVP